MGISLFRSFSEYDKPVVKPQPLVAKGNPDPRNFKILRIAAFESYTVVWVQYPDCTNYEGSKILVYQLPKTLVESLRILDPHFSSEKPAASPIARFVPTEIGWKMAENFVRAWMEYTLAN